MKTRKSRMLLLIPVLLLTQAFACSQAQIHPGSPNAFDSATYDTLIATHSIIETTKTDLLNNVFPVSIAPNVKTALNTLIQAYNVADSSYKAYHDSALAGTATSTQQAQVQAAVNQVNASTAALTNAKAGK